MSSMFSLEGKVAIVTGASRWTGKVIALEMAKAGVDLVISARTPKPLEAAAAEVRKVGRRCIAVPTDVGDSAAVLGDPQCIVPPGDAPSLARAILQRLDDLDRGAVAREALRQRIVTRFSMEALIDRTEAALQPLMQEWRLA